MTLFSRAPVLALVALVAVPPRVPRPMPSDTAIERIATLGTPRSVHTSTALSASELLVTGGMATEGGSLASAEVVNIATGTTHAVGSMHEARSSHTATMLPNGRVLIIGGYNGDYLASVELFDPTARRFAVAGRLQVGRSDHTATTLPDGKILIVGGVGQGWTFLSSAELFDPATGTSRLVGSMAVPRESHTATLLSNGRVLIVGGHNGRRDAMEVYTSAEVYDPATARFQAAGQMEIPRHKHDAVRLADGRVMIIGGADRTDRRHFSSTEVFDPQLGRFAPGPAMRTTRYKIAGTSRLLPDGDVLVPSGALEAERLDRETFTFQPVAGSFPTALLFSTATLMPAGDVVIVGGYGDGIRSSAGVWRYRGQ